MAALSAPVSRSVTGRGPTNRRTAYTQAAGHTNAETTTMALLVASVIGASQVTMGSALIAANRVW